MTTPLSATRDFRRDLWLLPILVWAVFALVGAVASEPHGYFLYGTVCSAPVSSLLLIAYEVGSLRAKWRVRAVWLGHCLLVGMLTLNGIELQGSDVYWLSAQIALTFPAGLLLVYAGGGLLIMYAGGNESAQLSGEFQIILGTIGFLLVGSLQWFVLMPIAVNRFIRRT